MRADPVRREISSSAAVGSAYNDSANRLKPLEPISCPKGEMKKYSLLEKQYQNMRVLITGLN